MQKSLRVLLVAVAAMASGEVVGGLAAGQTADDPRAPGTLKMAALLEKVANEMNAGSVAALSAERVELKKQRIQGVIGKDREPAGRLALAKETMQAGDAQGALDEFDRSERAYLQGKMPRDPKFEWELLRWRAMAALRLGEEENCLAHHGCSSCIAPIVADGQHRERRGAELAIDYYTKMLEIDPEDLEARWLINLAYMTLGKWPDQVPEKIRIQPNAFDSGYDIKRFHDIAPALGLARSTGAGGVCVEDFDNDGLLDIVATSMGPRDQMHYYRNNGDGTFADRTHEAGLDGIIGGLNAVHADYDNDGFADVLVLRGAWWGDDGMIPNSLLRNLGNGKFEDVTIAAGILSFHPTQAGQWADLDNDGWLDLIIGNENHGKGDRHPAELFHNNRDGTFTEVAAAVGARILGWVKGVAAGDYDNDGRVDLYYSRRGSANILLHNEPDPTEGSLGFRFTDATESAGVAQPKMSFPTWFFDYDNDGRLDLFVAANSGFENDHFDDIVAIYTGAELLSDHPCLYHNDGGGKFTDVAGAAGVDRAVLTMGSNFGDFDNDGWLDFYLGNGAPDFRMLLPNRAFHNNGGKCFQDVTTSGGFGHIQKGHAIAFADLDNDGDQDVYLDTGGLFSGDIYPTVVFANPGHGNHWITLKLRGVKANRCAIGARIRVDAVTPAGPRSIHVVCCTGGSFGSSSLQQEIGLGDATAIAAIEIRWPGSGTVSRFESVGIDRVWQAVEGEPALAEVAVKKLAFAGASEEPCCEDKGAEQK